MVVPSKDDKMQRTTKLDRIGELAEKQRDIVFNNLGHVIDLELLSECYRRLDGRKAKGVDGITKEGYGVRLEDNLQDLLRRIRKGAYKPRASKIVEIPKEDGSTRPLAISCFEDKLVQMAVSSILTKIFEPLFLPCSYGYREGIGSHEALRALLKHNDRNPNGCTVEIDLQKYFNSIPHEILIGILKSKINDERFLNLVKKLIRAPIIEGGKAQLNVQGCPQGSIISPILANVYLHFVIDDWFYKIKATHLRGKAELVRYADDMVFVFQYQEEAEKFYKVLPKRLKKYGLELHKSKSQIITSGSKAAEEAHKKGVRLPTYKFLGFVCYWGRSRSGHWRLKYKSRSDRITTKFLGLKQYLRRSLNLETRKVIGRVIRIVKGWINYHAISDNQKSVNSFIYLSECILYKWINRKGGQRKMNWVSFSKLLRKMNFPKHYRITSMFTSHRNSTIGSRMR